MSEIINVYDNKSKRLIKQLYSRYAVQIVRKKKGYWIDRSSIILVYPKHTILIAFPKAGDTLSSADAVAKLENAFEGEPYSKMKAIASLGGASKHRFIAFNAKTNLWKRIR